MRQHYIPTYVMRRGRMSAAQERALATMRDRYVLPMDGRPIDFAKVFGREAPVVLEIGFGMGEATAAMADAWRDKNFLAVDVHTPGVGGLIDKCERRGLTNVRIIEGDAILVLRDMIPPDSLARVHIFFPDPWPKKRHHKRRIIRPDLVPLIVSRIQPGGILHTATDWEPYAEQMLQVLSAEPLLENCYEGYAPRPDYRPLTKFEQQGLAKGHTVRDLIFRRKV
ncbi:tRNA (guanosine(46)-N7)-methyltransferase TrmB [Carbonactinospora thermoautotrophica]|uniref:tRNA (guanine-N(7)-)-methyltransferase n=2 Tax=Carbonactinospora thermoautotrophica TaxID=1469144 RepID=A0A132MVX6_9ACTN|nr:tRNA (guanosine(46)-N7)-methyltransferase TrmB [Carbonactinospora thermoautotrophica]KWX02055.1 tRNA (guanine-N(7)-)-methyltransferase [Carbonactinospora thermoautotrophica]MCX9189979.1 tRNA (guanosine(46)-N7)-methyltransferase TrmB [Carbonactinospora thermoautotrophica]